MPPPPPPPVPRFRQMCQSIIAHKLFDYVVLAFIFSNCITVALERPKILQGSLVKSHTRATLRLLPGGDHPDMKPFIFTLNCIMSSSSPPLSPHSCCVRPGKSLPHHLQLHLHRHLCGRDDTQGNILQHVSLSYFFFWNFTANNSLMAAMHTLACPPRSHVLFPSLLFLAIPMFL